MKRNSEDLQLAAKLDSVTEPAYVIDEANLKYNLEILRKVQEATGAKILLAQKAFSAFAVYPLIAGYLKGATASGLFEAKLCHEFMPRSENHIFSPAYQEKDFDEILSICDHLVFNSMAQWERFAPRALAMGKKCGMRINPECSTQEGHDIYDPCSPNSRLGIRKEDFSYEKLKGISGLHFHTLCEQNADALAVTLEAVEEKFGEYLKDMQWLNFGGGHHITRDDYDIDLLIKCIKKMQDKYGVTVYLEPGEAVALNAGYLVAEVIEIQPEHGGVANAILNVSASCHMPDVLEMPYRPRIIGSGERGEKQYNYRFGGATCLAGDVIGEYSFDEALQLGSKLIFCDMAIYSMVKNNTFNGMPLPKIMLLREDDSLEDIKAFSYEDFKMRLS